MKKYSVLFVVCLVLFLSAGSVFAQGFSGPTATTGQNVVFPGQGFAGFFGPVQSVTFVLFEMYG